MSSLPIIQTSGEFLSNSRIYMFNKCRQAYQYKYKDLIKPAAKGMYLDSWKRMLRGVMIHAGIEAGFLGHSVEDAIRTTAAKERAKGLTNEQKFELTKMEAESPLVCKALLDWLPASDWEPIMYRNKPMVEARLEIGLPGWKGFLGFADLVARHKPSGRVCVLDWKTRETFEADDVDVFNTQFLLYSYVLAQMGVEVHGSLLVEAKPVPPKRKPRIVREDVGGIDSVRVSADGRFRSIPTFRSPAYLAAGWADFCKQALVIAAARDEDIYRNMGAFSCKSCEFRHICQAELQGYDVQHVLDTGYAYPKSATIIMED